MSSIMKILKDKVTKMTEVSGKRKSFIYHDCSGVKSMHKVLSFYCYNVLTVF